MSKTYGIHYTVADEEQWTEITADTFLHRPGDGWIVFERDSRTVAEFHADSVAAVIELDEPEPEPFAVPLSRILSQGRPVQAPK